MVLEFTRNDIVKQLVDHLEKAEQFYHDKNYRDAIEEYFQALPLTKYTTHVTLGRIKLQIANCYYWIEDYKLAVKYFDQIMDDYQSDVSVTDYILAITRKGVSLGKMGYYNEALKQFEDLSKLDNREAKTRAYINLGVLYFKLYRLYERDCLSLAQECLSKALLLVHDEQKDRKHGILRNMGMIYHEQKKYLKALEIYDNAINLVTDPVQVAKTYSEMAKTYIVLMDFKTAAELLNQGQEILIRHKDFYGLSYSLMVRGMLYERKNDMEAAHNYLQTALFGFLEIQAYPEVVETCFLLYKLFVGNDQSRADVYYEHYKFYINYVDPMGTA